MFQYLRHLLRPSIPDDVANDLDRLVSLFMKMDTIPIREIRLFGSLQKGTWNRQRSDIDIAVILNTAAEEYSVLTRVLVAELPDYDGGTQRITTETEARKKLRSLVRESNLQFREKYTLHLLTLPDFELIRAEDPPFATAITRGRLLYEPI